MGWRKDDRQVEYLFKVFLSFGEISERQFPWQQLRHKLLWNSVNVVLEMFSFLYCFQKHLITDLIIISVIFLAQSLSYSEIMNNFHHCIMEIHTTYYDQIQQWYVSQWTDDTYKYKCKIQIYPKSKNKGNGHFCLISWLSAREVNHIWLSLM